MLIFRDLETGGGYLRPLKKENLNRIYRSFENRTGRIGFKVYSALEIKPIGIVGEGFIEEESNWILDDCNFVAEKRIVDTEDVRQQTVVYGGFMRHQWGHFIVNTMSRLWFIFAHSEVKFDKIVFCLPPGEKHRLTGNYYEFFKWLNLLEKIEFIETATAFATVIVPELSWSLQHHFSNEFNLVYDALIQNVQSAHANEKHTYPRKIFFSRAKLAKSRLSEIGVEFLDNFFDNNGFTIISPENLSLEQMILYLQHADVVAGASGSTVHNIILGKKGQRLLICERNCINNDFQPGINLARRVDVTHIDSFLTVNSVNSGLGPFLYYPTRQVMDFAVNNGMKLPSEVYLSEKWIKKKLKRYFRTWRKFYNRQWYFQKFALPEINAFYEAYVDSLDTVGDYLCGRKELYLSDYLSITHIVKKYFGSVVLEYLRRVNRFIHNY